MCVYFSSFTPGPPRLSKKLFPRFLIVDGEMGCAALFGVAMVAQQCVQVQVDWPEWMGPTGGSQRGGPTSQQPPRRVADWISVQMGKQEEARMVVGWQ